MGDLVTATDVVALMQDESFVDELIKELVDDPEVMDEIADDMAEELSDLLEDDPSFKKKLMAAAMGTTEFKKRIVKNMVKDIGD